MGGGLLEPII